MTLSMNPIASSNAANNINSYSTSQNTSSGIDFSEILNLLLSSSMSSTSDSGSSSYLQTMLLALAPYLQNLESANMATSAPSGMPANGILTQGYSAAHQGLDIGIDIGTGVHSTMPGKVTYAGWNNEGYGNLVIVDNGTYQTYYGHLSSVNVGVGDTVSSGDVVGLSGSTGNSTGPHLHYEVRVDGKRVDPTSYAYGKISQYMV